MRSDLIKKIRIGKVELENNLALAPLAGFGDMAFRRLCKSYGVGLTTTEMVSVNGLKYKNAKTELLLKRGEGETPCAVQLFGSDPETFRKVLLECETLRSFDIVDINMGCPMPKVTKLGAGSALLADTARAADIVRACAAAAGVPVTVKMRLGIACAFGAEEFARAMQDAGAAALTVHGRTARQLYGGKADWQAIARVKAAVDIPVYGNGDITDTADFEEKMSLSHVDGAAIGRGAVGNPKLFSELLGKETDNRKHPAIQQLEYMSEYFPERYTVAAFRKHAAHYFKGEAGAASLRKNLLSAKTVDEIMKLIYAHID